MNVSTNAESSSPSASSPPQSHKSVPVSNVKRNAIMVAMGILAVNVIVVLAISRPSGTGAPSTDKPANGAHVWLRADLDVKANLDTEQVSFWGDQSGQENHAFMQTLPRCPTVAYNAVNGHPVMRFNGSQSFQLTTPLSYPDMTIFVVGKNNQTADAFSIILGPGDTTPNHQLRWQDGSSVLAVGIGIDLPIIKATIGDTRVYHALAVGYNGTSIQFYRDGIQVSSDITNFETTDRWILYFIGAWHSTYFLTGDIAEMLVYPTVLSDADRARTDAYLRSRYALP